MFLEHCESWLIKNLTREYIVAAERYVEERLSPEVLQNETSCGVGQSACNFAEDVNSERSLKQLWECRSSYLKMGALHVCIQRFPVLPNLNGEIPSLLSDSYIFVAATALLFPSRSD